jgi:PKD repeat protein
LAACLATVLGGGCGDAVEPNGMVPLVDTLTVAAVSMAAVRLEWAPVGDVDVISYRVERRANLIGSFAPIATSVPQTTADEIVFFDVGLEPDTYYGYRVVAQSRFGARSLPSLVRAARTPPPPAVLVVTSTAHATPAAIDGDGYVAFLHGAADSVSIPIGPTGEVRFGPLAPGSYMAELRGVAPQCTVQGPALRAATVTDQGVRTVDTVRYTLSCRDPALGRLTALVTAHGDSLDPSGYSILVTGLLGPPAAPVSLRGSIRDPAGGVATFDNLVPGAYEVSLDSVASHCSLTGGPLRTVDIQALSDDTVRYEVTCQGSGGGGGGNRPYTWRNVWSAATVPPNQRVTLDITLDLTANAAERVSTVQAVTDYNAAALRFDSATAGDLDQGFVVNGSTPGRVIWGDFAFTTLPGGNVALVHLFFTATGPVAATSATRTTIDQLLAADEATELDTLVRIVEDTVTIGSGGGNLPPAANANGPYSGTVNTPIAFSAAGSADPDGSIAGYAWTFGDGGAAAGTSPSHTYQNAGTYTATLTVTDNQGATDTDQATVTVTGGGGGNQAPVAEANGPYSGAPGTPIAFSAAGSFDQDGTIATYAWTFGDGGAGSGLNPSHTYAAAGTYAATVTVTDNLGATDTDQATVTVSGGGQTMPFTWAGAFGAINPVDSVVALTLTLDLTTSIVETPGLEELATFIVDSLKWDRTVLRYHAFNWGPGGSGVVNPTDVLTQGKLAFRSFTLPTTNNSGVIAIATIRFKVIGSPGRATTTATSLGALTGTAATGSYPYGTRTHVQEATIAVP